MDFRALSEKLAELKGDYFLIQCPTMDFTDTEHVAHIDIFSGDKELRLDLTRPDLPRIAGILRQSIFNRDLKPGRVICWDIKNLFSYFRHFTGEDFLVDDPPASQVDGSKKTPLLLDLKILERYCGIINSEPSSYIEAVKRLRRLDLSGLKKIYNKMHIPLIRDVIPYMESAYLVRGDERVYSHYEIEGEVTGRLKARSLFKHSYNPHIMGAEEREVLKTPYKDIFVYLDFAAWEIRIGQWLSGDEALGALFNEKDVYFSIFETLTGKKETHPKCRKFTKNLILPVMFGAGASSISKSLEISEKNASSLIDRLYGAFPDLFSYLRSQITLIQDGFATDYFGRKRSFEQGQEYKAMNFCIQSPAATVCLLKLVDLYRALKFKKLGRLAFSVHDGFGILCNREEFNGVVGLATEVLESESEVYPGLRLKVAASAGMSLGKLKELKRKG